MQIGLVVALALVAATFSFAPEEYWITAAARTDALIPVDLIAVTTQEPKKQELVKIEVKALTQMIKVIDNNQKLAEEAIRVLNTSPKWSPGKQRNQPVRVKYTLPVDFRLN